MSKKQYFLAALLLACSEGIATAAEPLSLDSCISLALRNNREVQMAHLNVQRYHHTARSLRANYYPNISAQVIDLWNSTSGTYTFEAAQFLPEGLMQSFATASTEMLSRMVSAGLFSAQEAQALGQNLSGLSSLSPSLDYKIGNVFYAALMVEQPIYMGGKITAAYQMGRKAETMASLNTQLKESEVVVTAHEAYALLQKATEMTRVAERYDSLLASLLHDVKNAERHGLRDRNDVLKVSVKKKEAALSLLQARNATRLAEMNLCHTIGLPLSTSVTLASYDAPLPATSDLQTDEARVRERPEYQLLSLKTEIAAAKVKMERAALLPQVGLAASVGYAHGVEIASNYLIEKPSFTILANVSVPIYHGGEGQHKVKAARLEREHAQLEQEEAVEKMCLELQQAANGFEESAAEVALTEEMVAEADENVRHARLSFDNGLGTTSDLLEAQTLWQQAAAKHAIAQSTLLTQYAKYKKAAALH